MNNKILVCNSLSKIYKQADAETHIFENLSFAIDKGECVSIIGSSGSGKTTLLHLLAGLDTPSSGEVIVCDENIHNLNEQKKSQFRNKNMGFVYQFHHLLPEFTALENTLMPAIIGGSNNKEAKERALYVLAKLKLSHRLNSFPATLSGGERQRVAIARSVINNPQLIMADEPTGNLDYKTAAQVMELFFELQQELKTSVVIVTHDVNIHKNTDKAYMLNNGCLELLV